jgi:hypothetical protein
MKGGDAMDEFKLKTCDEYINKLETLKNVITEKIYELLAERTKHMRWQGTHKYITKNI